MRRLVIVNEGNVWLFGESGSLRLPYESEADVRDGAETFSLDGYVAVSGPDVTKVSGDVLEKRVREACASLPLDDSQAVVKCVELLNWNAAERYCARDSSPLERATVISKRCGLCGKEYFPRLNPAIVVLVTRGDSALLVHSRNLAEGVHALVAGYVETGETLEECVAREIMEETSVEVSDIRYVGSQSWPFPYQLMMGFTARYRGGDVRFADGEITSGGFFTRDSLPPLPSPPSLSRRIIDQWISGTLPE